MKQLLISLRTPNRAAVVENGRLEELFVSNERDAVGNIYRGRVVRIEPALNAAFVDIGSACAAFLPVDDIRANSAPGNASPQKAPATPSTVARGGQPRPSISDLLRPAQDLMVQVTKAPRQQRGAVVSTLLSIPGRYLVMTNAVEGVQFSRKIPGQKERQRLIQIVRRAVPSAVEGIIVREAAVDRSREDIEIDLANLNQLWQRILDKFDYGSNAPDLLYDDSDLVRRMLRDVCDDSFEEIWLDDADSLTSAESLLHQLNPHHSLRLELHTGPEPLFTRLGIQQQILGLSQREVDLSHGAKIVIDKTQWLTAIDVLPGGLHVGKRWEEQMLATNLEAASEIARQLRLRNVSGVGVIDFLDMQAQGERRKVEQFLTEATKHDIGMVKLLPMSEFGLIELTRRGVRTSSIESDEEIGSDAAIFISYRREDTEHQVGRIYDWLIRHFGQSNIFYDIDTIPVGVDWLQYLKSSIGKCTVLLAPIGDRWLEELNRARTDDDFVSFEIETALSRDIPIVPLLVARAGMPTATQLPKGMQRLAVRNGIPIRPGRDFEPDVMRLISILQGFGISSAKG